MDGRGPYGLACRVCYKAKARCTKLKDGSGCQRCWRLGKECLPSDSIRRRNMANFQLTQFEHLEGRLNDLTRLLEAMRQGGLPPMSFPLQQQLQLQLQQQLQLPLSMSMPPPPPPGAVLPSHQTPPPPPSESGGTPEPQQGPEGIVGEQPSSPFPPRDEEDALAVFRNNMLHFCPFICLRPGLTAQDLKDKRPFLFKSILAVTARSVNEKIDRAKDLKMQIAYEMIVDHNSSVDLLLGLMVYICWGNDQYIHKKLTLSRLMELALSLAHELRLDSPPAVGTHMFHDLGGQHLLPLRPTYVSETMEGKRAALGCFLLASSISIFYRTMNWMPWTSQLQKFLEILEKSPEWAGDMTLTTHVRLQLLVQQVKEAREQHPGQPCIPFFVKSFLLQLDKLRSSISPELEKKALIIAHVHYVELSIYETAFSAYVNPHSSDDDDEDPHPIGPDAIDCMSQSLLAIQSWIAAYVKISTEDHVGITIMTWSQMGLALVTLFRLTTHPAPDWDKGTVHKQGDVVKAIGTICNRIERVAPVGNKVFPDDVWERIGMLAFAIRSWIYSQLETKEVRGPAGEAAVKAAVRGQAPESLGSQPIEAPTPPPAEEPVEPVAQTPAPACVPMDHAASTQGWVPTVSAWDPNLGSLQPIQPLEYPMQYGYTPWPSMAVPMGTHPGGMQY
ncbi:hypothetical protein BDV06DRAFT_24169 [Aspergillus oleicola]